MKSRRKLSHMLLDYGIIIFLVLLILFFSFTADSFFATKTLITVLRQSAISGIIAVGMAFCIFCGGIDLSVGSVAAVTCVAFCMMYNHGLTGIPAILLGCLIGAGFGIINGACVNFLRIPPLIATLAMSTTIRGLAYLITGGIYVRGMPASIMWFSQASLWIVPLPVVLMLVVFAVASFTLHQTPFGRHIYAVGGNDEASRLSGINVTKIRFISYVISGVCAAVGGMLLASRTNSGQPASGIGYEMDAITACVLGGLSIAGGEGEIWFVIVGVLITGVLKTGMVMMYLSDYTQEVVQGLVLIAAVAFSGFSQRIKARAAVKEQES